MLKNQIKDSFRKRIQHAEQNNGLYPKRLTFTYHTRDTWSYSTITYQTATNTLEDQQTQVYLISNTGEYGLLKDLGLFYNNKKCTTHRIWEYRQHFLYLHLGPDDCEPLWNCLFGAFCSEAFTWRDFCKIKFLKVQNYDLTSNDMFC